VLISSPPDVQLRGCEDIYELIGRHSCPVDFISRHEMEELSGSTAHQSFAALLHPRSFMNLHDLLENEKSREKSLLVFLDEIFDPHNLGAILRASECFSASAVVWSKNRGADLSATAAKSSAGASELLSLCKVSNLVSAIRDCKDAGFWVVTADNTETADSLGSFQFPEKTLLVLGSEGRGLKALIKKEADFSLKIPLSGQLDSLNVSQAAAVLLHAYRQQHSLV